MGMICCFESVPTESWPLLVDRAVEAGMVIEERGQHKRCPWCTLRRGRAGLGMALDPSKPPGTVYLYCNVLHYWSRPLATRRLFRDVAAIVLSQVQSADG